MVALLYVSPALHIFLSVGFPLTFFQLLHAVIWTLPFNGVRLVYAVTSLILRTTHPDSSFLTSTPATVCLSVVEEILVVLILIVAGVRTRGLRKTVKTMEKYEPQPMQTGLQPLQQQPYDSAQYQGGQQQGGRYQNY